MVKAISSTDNNVKTVRQRTIDDGKKGLLIGAVGGAVEGFTRKSWLTKGEPSDTFVKSVSKKLVTALEPEEQAEVEKVKTFFKQLNDYRTNVYEMRERIENSTELTNAVRKNDGETTKDALDRIFANKNKLEVKKELRNMQNRTVIDKKVDVYAARRLVKANFDAGAKKLKKSAAVSDEVFGFLKSAARGIKLKTSMQHTLVGGFLIGAAGLLVGARAANSQKK